MRIPLTRRTLLYYEELGVVPKPQRGGGGRGGRWTDYPPAVIEEAYVAWSLAHGKYGDEDFRAMFGKDIPRIPLNVVSIVRGFAIKYDEMVNQVIATSDDHEDKYNAFKNSEDQMLRELLKPYTYEQALILKAYMLIWLKERDKARLLVAPFKMSSV